MHNTLDSTFSDLHSKGVGAIINHAGVISFDDEQKLLDSNIMSMEDPASLLNLVFFYVGMHFCLRGGQEQRDLQVDQVRRCPPDTSTYDSSAYYEYNKFISKNSQHRFKDIHTKNY